MKRILLTLLFVLMALLAVIGLILTLGGRDIPPPDVSDLTVERPAIAPEDNAYVSFMAMANLITAPENEKLPPTRRRWKADDIVFDLAPPAREQP